MAHTPTPWHINDHGKVYVRNKKHDTVCVTGFALSIGSNAEAIANNEFIIRAVNAHDDLMIALEMQRINLVEARNEMAALLSDPDVPEFPVSTTADDACLKTAYRILRDGIVEIDAALTKSKPTVSKGE